VSTAGEGHAKRLSGRRGLERPGADQILDQIAARLDPADPRAARRRAIGLYTLLVGTLQLARALPDPTTSDEVLRAGIENVQLLIGTPPARPTAPERTSR
jgi:hypothetical protein